MIVVVQCILSAVIEKIFIFYQISTVRFLWRLTSALHSECIAKNYLSLFYIHCNAQGYKHKVNNIRFFYGLCAKKNAILFHFHTSQKGAKLLHSCSTHKTLCNKTKKSKKQSRQKITFSILVFFCNTAVKMQNRDMR